MIKLFFILTVFCAIGCMPSQTGEVVSRKFDHGMEELVLQEKNVGIDYFVKIHMIDEVREYRMTYCGSIENRTLGKLHIIYSTVFTGMYEDSKRANSIIALYQGSNRLGHYYVGGGFGKSPVVLQDTIIVSYEDDICNKITRICLKDSIPQKIFIMCDERNGNTFGDLFNFTSQE